jgi:hypothetical protein
MSSETQTNLSGWCGRDDHGRCDGTLRGASGYHWWCVCACHPKPSISHVPDRVAARKALDVWQSARDALGGGSA